MSKISWQYIAGFVDGEGCIYFVRFVRDKNSPYRGGAFSIQQIITNRKVIDEIHEFLNQQRIFSHIYICKQSKNAMGKIPIISLEIARQRDLLNFLKEIVPFLIVKKEKAQQVISLIEKQQIKRRGTSKLSWREQDEIIKLWNEGKTTTEIGEKMGRSVDCIIKFLKKKKQYQLRKRVYIGKGRKKMKRILISDKKLERLDGFYKGKTKKKN